jgi:hypothetical protein
MLRGVGAANGEGLDGSYLEQLLLAGTTPGAGDGSSVLLAETEYLGVTFYAGAGPLPDPSTMPNTIYILLPQLG